MALERILPRYDASERHAIVVRADAARTYAALRTLDLVDLPLTRVLMAVPALPDRLLRRPGLPPRRPRTPARPPGAGFPPPAQGPGPGIGPRPPRGLRPAPRRGPPA